MHIQSTQINAYFSLYSNGLGEYIGLKESSPVSRPGIFYPGQSHSGSLMALVDFEALAPARSDGHRSRTTQVGKVGPNTWLDSSRVVWQPSNSGEFSFDDGPRPDLDELKGLGGWITKCRVNWRGIEPNTSENSQKIKAYIHRLENHLHMHKTTWAFGTFSYSN